MKTKKLLLTWALMLVIIYALLEVFFFNYAAKIFPMLSLAIVKPGGQLLVQYSKQDVFPKNYIAIFGDSYAYGQGDWFLSVALKIRPVYSPTQLIHKKLERDVLSFGRPASDNMSSNNMIPSALLAAARAGNTQQIADPSTIIVYFYEGNDLNDNVEVYNKLMAPNLGATKNIMDADVAQSEIKKLVENYQGEQTGNAGNFSDRLYFAHFAQDIVCSVYDEFVLGTRQKPWKPEKNGVTTKARFGDSIEPLPDRLQSPALTLSHEEMDLGLYLFGQSLVYLHNQFPNARVGIAYIPSVITPYDVVSPTINNYYPNKNAPKETRLIQSSKNIQLNSDYICNRVRNIANQMNFGFVDTRKSLRRAAKNQRIHGPIDWNHFNQIGYEILTENLLALIHEVESTDNQSNPICQWE